MQNVIFLQQSQQFSFSSVEKCTSQGIFTHVFFFVLISVFFFLHSFCFEFFFLRDDVASPPLSRYGWHFRPPGAEFGFAVWAVAHYLAPKTPWPSLQAPEAQTNPLIGV